VSDALVHRNDDDRIAVITLDSPANRNALSRRLIAELTDHLTEAGADESLHGILLRSSHPVFCAGADLKEAATVDMVESARGIIALQRAIVAAPVPVVTRLDGPVRAGGLGLVASSDIVVCADSVTVALTEVRLGLAAAVISIPLRARLSPRAASDWFLTGRSVSATEARDQGLVTHVAQRGRDGCRRRARARPPARGCPAGPGRGQAPAHHRPRRAVRQPRRRDGAALRAALPLGGRPAANGRRAAPLRRHVPAVTYWSIWVRAGR
jgi:enoyl-CoA hydratase/carnithine racemase